MVVCATSLVPLEWRVDGSAWAVIFPLAYVNSNSLEIYAADPILVQRRHWLPYPISGTSPLA